MNQSNMESPVAQAVENAAPAQARHHPEWFDETAEQGLAALMEKLAPLIKGQRLHNVVDLLSLLSDVVDMTDDAMIQKLMKAYEGGIGAAWTLNNAARYAQNTASRTPPPSLLGLVKAAGHEDVRRGLHFALLFLGVLGRQMREDTES